MTISFHSFGVLLLCCCLGAANYMLLFQCIACDSQNWQPYSECHRKLPERIKTNGENCAERFTNSTHPDVVLPKICQSLELIYEIVQCTDVRKGSPGGKKEK
ncbi:uncharacterized protein LOC118199163, partial [Stegodyphus dumicola]|uniref:uncharacterized protein LOC118199163 n=1 Tax=Stegodyphus dumicola TaxID=202533 RepID=UPI0015AFF2FD